MYHDLILMSIVPMGLTCCEREPPVPPGEPTVLNKERAGKSTEARKHRGAKAPDQNREGMAFLVATSRDRVR